MIKYVKEFSRNYSLFQAVVYGNFVDLKKEDYNILVYTGKPLLIHEGLSLVGLYYPERDLEKIYNQFTQPQFDSIFFEKVLNNLYKTIELISPYFHKQKEIKSIEELKVLYGLYVDFYFCDSVVWVVPVASGISDELKQKFLKVRESVQELSEYRDDVFDYYLSKLFPNFGELVHFLNPQSVFGGKSEGELKKEAEEYCRGYVLYDGKLYAGNKSDILSKLNVTVEEHISKHDIKEIRGEIAARGTVSGMVKIIFTSKDLHKISEGDVLVSPMTRPEFLSAMNRSVAFITDEGGITCHAAIIARELKKPCIIGTKIATQVLKDGDMVEVDGERGVVKILETKLHE